ncbi:hypothetical protein BPT24_148 [Tenacibaculum phage pT24]|uniref:Uncharacterized protein n=1 Tax=Tenacibaculum phage pT24 TaxID=1880590 RepID=A0A1B4XWV6_9CAUD|nr:hypothetical protein HYP10_gp148 [Tenacibaculum phage pT24]BAV39274.1 hypothetical protein BPT24_148 [Tenacibaculum phage pT24]
MKRTKLNLAVKLKDEVLKRLYPRYVDKYVNVKEIHLNRVTVSMVVNGIDDVSVDFRLDEVKEFFNLDYKQKGMTVEVETHKKEKEPLF